ncbi:hypothetical protein BGZ54_004547 [Gamsiella multidivaricata]|nr:hypothetical protein BGZ54_004547 [Gamsiella multidivaricata]
MSAMPQTSYSASGSVERADYLVQNFAYLWPSACPSPDCPQSFPRQFYKVQPHPDSTLYYCVCAQSHVTLASVYDTLEPILAALYASGQSPTHTPTPFHRNQQVPWISNPYPDCSDTSSFGTILSDCEDDSEDDSPDEPVTPPVPSSQISPHFVGPYHHYVYYPVSTPHSLPVSTHPVYASPIFVYPQLGHPQGAPAFHDQHPPTTGPIPVSPHAPFQPAASMESKASVSLAKDLLEEQYKNSALEQRLLKQAGTVEALEAEKSALQNCLSQSETDVSALRAEIAELRAEIAQALVLARAASVAAPAPVPAATSVAAAPALPQPLPRAKPPVAVGPTTAAAPAAAAGSPSGYLAAARRGLSAAQLDVIRGMKPAPRPFRARAPAGVTPAASSLVRLYFGNVQSCPLGQFKANLRALRIRTSAIANIAFVGKAIVELMVESHYRASLIAKMQEFTFRHLPNYDPAVPQDPHVTPEVRVRLQEAYARRLQQTAGNTTRPVVRQVVLAMMSTANIPVPSDLPDSTRAAAVAPADAP